MLAHSFDATTAKEYVGDTRMRGIEDKARSDADKNNYAPLHGLKAAFCSYAAEVSAQMDDTVYFNAFSKRTARNQRMTDRSLT